MTTKTCLSQKHYANARDLTLRKTERQGPSRCHPVECLASWTTSVPYESQSCAITYLGDATPFLTPCTPCLCSFQWRKPGETDLTRSPQGCMQGSVPGGLCAGSIQHHPHTASGTRPQSTPSSTCWVPCWRQSQVSTCWLPASAEETIATSACKAHVCSRTKPRRPELSQETEYQRN